MAAAGAETKVDLDALRAQVTKQAGLVRQLKAEGAEQVSGRAGEVGWRLMDFAMEASTRARAAGTVHRGARGGF